MDRPGGPAPPALRRWLFWILVLGLAGTEVELLLLAHYEDAWQWTPLVLIALTAGVVLWHRNSDTKAGLRALKALMILSVVAGGLGVCLHFRGATQFQREINPAEPFWNIAAKVLRSKAPPVLAPGIMIQLGLIGLVYVRLD